MYQEKLQDGYDGDIEGFRYYSDIYGLAERLGFNSVEEAWEANPLIQGSTNPDDFMVVKSVRKRMLRWMFHLFRS